MKPLPDYVEAQFTPGCKWCDEQRAQAEASPNNTFEGPRQAEEPQP